MNEINNNIISIQAKNSIDESETKEIESVNNQYNIIKEELQAMESDIAVLSHKTKVKIDDIENRFNKDKELSSFYNSKVESITNNWKSANDRLENLSRNILDLEANISSYENQGKDIIESQYKESNNKIDSMIKEIKELGLEPDINIIDSIKSLLSFYQSFINKLDRFYDELDTNDISIILNWDNNIDKAKEEQSHLINQLEITKEKISNLSADIKVISILDNRPKNCKIDSCPFIASALELKKQYKNTKLDKQLSDLLALEMQFSDSITEQGKLIDHLIYLDSKRMILDDLRAIILENRYLEPTFKEDIFYNFETQLSNISQFNNQRDPRRYIDGLAILQLYQAELQLNKELKIKYDAYIDQIQLMNNNKTLLNDMKSERESLIVNIQDYKNDIDKFISLRNAINNNIEVESKYYQLYLVWKEKNEILSKLEFQIQEFNNKSSKALKSIETISNLRKEIDNIKQEDDPLLDSITKLEGQLVLLNSYYEEYNNYIGEYNMIETVKKYCSPTGGGIQTIFIQLYMRKTLEISNQILTMLFNGQYRLIDFIINEKEFKIPFVGPSGLQCDDISSGSMSQVEMMGMVINLALLYQASTKFNIAYLDEIGSGLDNHNQGEFIKVIYYISKYLNMEQIFMICHSLAVDESGVDIIKLKDYEEFENNSTGNIIYNYKEDNNENPI
jgi:chromosome segregation ATPase